MKMLLFFLAVACTAGGSTPGFAQQFERDTITTGSGTLDITFIGHASVMFGFDGKIIHVDPVTSEGDYSTLPDADLILVTHEHGDHLDLEAINQVRKEGTVIVWTETCGKQAEGTLSGIAMKNGESGTAGGFAIEAVPAYNIVNMRGPGQPYHPEGVGNGYIVTFGDTRVYVAGDTENIPEMKQIADIDIAFLPMNLPYTMTPEMVADAARTLWPRILYPYHFGQTDTSQLVTLLADEKDIEVRIRSME